MTEFLPSGSCCCSTLADICMCSHHRSAELRHVLHWSVAGSMLHAEGSQRHVGGDAEQPSPLQGQQDPLSAHRWVGREAGLGEEFLPDRFTKTTTIFLTSPQIASRNTSLLYRNLSDVLFLVMNIILNFRRHFWPI